VEPNPNLRRPPGPSRRRNLIESAIGFTTDPLGFVGGRFDKYGDIYYVPNKAGGFYVLKHPDHVHAVLVTHAAKMRKQHTAFELLSRVVGEGLLTTDGEVWRRQRRLLQPAFTQAKLAQYATAMIEAAGSVRDRLLGEFDISREMMELTLRVVCKTLFSHEITDETNDVARAMTVLQDSVSRPDLLPQWLPTPHRRRFKEAVDAIDRIVFDMIRDRRRTTTPPNDLLQSLITAVDEEGGAGLSEREIRDLLVTLFLAGHETTSHALTWTWYLLSQNPAAERALHEELDRVLGDRLPRADDPLPYAEQVIKESMRMYPPVYMLARKSAEQLELGGYVIPAGTELVMWLYQTQHDPRWFPEPGAFKPERFTPENEAKLPKGAYIPFGAGPRTCIGKTFAMMEARLLLATIAQKRRLRLAEGHRVAMRPRVTLNPKYGMRMVVSAR